MQVSNATSTHTSGARRPGRLVRRAAAVALAASAGLTGVALSATSASAWTPLPDPIPMPGVTIPVMPHFVPPVLPSIPPLVPPVYTPPVLPNLPIDPLPDPEPPAGGGDGPVITVPQPGSVIDPGDLNDPNPGGGPVIDPNCIIAVCPPATTDTVPENTTTTTTVPDETTTSTVPGSTVPDPEVLPSTTIRPRPQEVRTESRPGSLAFTGSDAVLPLAGAGLLGAGGALAGISVFARRLRNRRS